MGVQSAGTAIREARLKAGLSQEKLSAGVCSVLSLSRIENGSAGVSPSTFQALMAHAGAPCEAFPTFANRKDFDCFYALKRVRFYIDSWQLQEAYNELEKIENLNFAKNKYYYQEWLLSYCRLQFRSGMGNHTQIQATLLEALHISRPNIDLNDFRSLLLSLNEIELLIYYAQESLYLNQTDICLSICTQISTYLENSQIAFLEKDRLLAENAIVYSKYLLLINDYDAVLKITATHLKKMAINSNDTTRHELTFLSGLGYYYNRNYEEALTHFKTVFYSAHSIGSCYATICRNYLLRELKLSLPEDLLSVADIPLVSYPCKKAIDTADFSDGTYDLFSPEVITVGSLIRELRMERKIPQQSLCHGLCSKSKLSKIENGSLQPSVILAETLLQRLGLSEQVFTFYCNDKETTLHDLKIRTTHISLNNKTLIQDYTNQIEALLSSEDKLYLQYILYKRATITENNDLKIKLLHQAINVSQPDLEFNSLQSQYFSWCEINILCHLCEAYTQSQSPLKGIVLFFQLLDYLTQSDRDILDENRVFSIFMIKMVCSLYKLQHFTELCQLSPYFSKTSLKGHVYSIGNIFSHYAQALGECGKPSEINLYANYAYYNFRITNSVHAESFKQAMLLDWQLDLL